MDTGAGGIKYPGRTVAVTYMDTPQETRRSSLFYLWSIPREIFRHPNNRNHRIRALGRSVLWQAYKRLVGKPVTVRLFDGIRLRCYPDSVSASQVFYFGSYHEFDEMLFVSRFLRPGDGFIDGGANIGTYSLLAASIAGPSGRVEAFEPDPIAASRLRENVALNALTNVHVYEVALTDIRGRVRFAQGLDVSNRMVSSSETALQTADVEAVRLDECLDRRAAYMMAKLDLEGAEPSALRGAKKHLVAANPPVWQLEARERQLQRLGTSRHEVISLLGDCGYTFALYEARNRRLRSIDEPTAAHANFLAIHQSANDMVLERLTARQS